MNDVPMKRQPVRAPLGRYGKPFCRVRDFPRGLGGALAPVLPPGHGQVVAQCLALTRRVQQTPLQKVGEILAKYAAQVKEPGATP